MQAIQIRRLAPTDSLDDITALLHRAFEPLGRIGLACRCVDQPVAVTQQRLAAGDACIALAGDRIVGTITVCHGSAQAEAKHYRRADVASVHQLAVDPAFQGQSIGKALLQVAAMWAREQGLSELALDTPMRASHLIDYYLARGFRIVETLQAAGRDYRSVVMAKPIAVRRMAAPAWPMRRVSADGTGRALQRP